jgi:DNA-binding NarL/FixJ family response regulator
MPASTERIRLVIVDDHTLMREALASLLGAHSHLVIVGQTGTAAEAAEMCEVHRPDVVLLDVNLPDLAPIQAVRAVSAVSKPPRILALSMADDPDVVRDVLSAGAHGYLLKTVSHAELVTAVESVHRDHSRIFLSVSRSSLLSDTPLPRSTGPLSGREAEVLQLVAHGLSNARIGGRLSISEGTVKRHIQNIFGKLGVASRLEAVKRAVEAGLIELSPSGPADERQ